LQFGAVLAVSREGSPRQQDLLFAADLTGINISVPEQPIWTEEDLHNLYAERGSILSRGSALAWLGHLNALRWFLDSDLSTAIILEDDVDWDIHLRTAQVPLVSENLRKLLNSSATYWSDLSAWEILYLGHCGDFFPPDDLTTMQHAIFHDDTLLPHDKMHTETRHFLRNLAFAEETRMIHRSRWPLCTFGYAVTRASAHRIFNELAVREQNGGCQAYDVRILEACRDLDYRCFSVNPEIFHHVSVPSEIAGVNEGIDPQGRLQRQHSEKTPNLACGARSKSFYTDDEATMEYLREEVGVKGHCLVDDMEEDNTKPF
ncbi:glycosyltransferase family 25 protein, partial [Saccharata proteae CBS 121410]